MNSYYVVKYAEHNGERTKLFVQIKHKRLVWTPDIYKAAPFEAQQAIEVAEANKVSGAYVPAAFASWSRMSGELLKRAKVLEDNAREITRRRQ